MIDILKTLKPYRGVSKVAQVLIFLGILLIPVTIFLIYYFIETIKIIWPYSKPLAVLAVLVPPFAQTFFYLTPKDDFDHSEALMFKRYFMLVGAFLLVGIAASVVVPSMDDKDFPKDGPVLNKEFSSSPSGKGKPPLMTQQENGVGAESSKDGADTIDRSDVYAVHPDADSLIASPEFGQWVSSLPENEKDLVFDRLTDGTSNEVIFTLNQFKKHMAIAVHNDRYARQQSAMAAAQTERRFKKTEVEPSPYAYVDNFSNQGEVVSAFNTPANPQISQSDKDARERLLKESMTPVDGAHGLTASQRNTAANLLTGGSYAQPSPSTRPAPTNITNCDSAGCWDNMGNRYNKGAGETYFPTTGGACQNIGGQMQCN